MKFIKDMEEVILPYLFRWKNKFFKMFNKIGNFKGIVFGILEVMVFLSLSVVESYFDSSSVN